MSIVIAVVSVIGSSLVIWLTGHNPDLNGWVKGIIAAVAVLAAVYSMARVMPRETSSQKESRFAKVFEKSPHKV